MSDHFALLSLTPAFDIDIAALEQAYFRAQQQYHPDRFVGKAPEERALAAQQSASINQAYQTLKNPLKRSQYLLLQEGIRVGTDNDNIKPSQTLLMETIDWREAIEDGKPMKAELEALYHTSLGVISEAYNNKAFDAMAQETLRLGYIVKTLDDVKKKR